MLMTNLISTKPLSDCLFSMTTFNGFFGTLPTYEMTDDIWGQFVAITASADGPALVQFKDKTTYFVTCGLRVASYIGKTREKAVSERWGSLEGKQRSSSHCTASAILKFDLDGMTKEQWEVVQDRIKSSGLRVLAYSTWSHGLPEKPGVRVRVLVPMDTALEQDDYTLAWWGMAETLFSDLLKADESRVVGKIVDVSASNLSQQQGVWATSSDREDLAFRIHNKGGAAASDALVALGRIKHGVAKRVPLGTGSRVLNYQFMTPDTKRLKTALPWIPDDRVTWVKAGMAIKALAPLIGEGAAYPLWIEYSETGSNKKHNDEPDQSPESRWSGFAPTMPTEIALNTLFALARNGALAAVEAERGRANLSKRGHEAAQYLATHHKALFRQLNKGGV